MRIKCTQQPSVENHTLYPFNHVRKIYNILTESSEKRAQQHLMVRIQFWKYEGRVYLFHLTGTTPLSGPWNNCNEEVLYTPQISRPNFWMQFSVIPRTPLFGGRGLAFCRWYSQRILIPANRVCCWIQSYLAWLFLRIGLNRFSATREFRFFTDTCWMFMWTKHWLWAQLGSG